MQTFWDIVSRIATLLKYSDFLCSNRCCRGGFNPSRTQRQRDHLELIASEKNFTSAAKVSRPRLCRPISMLRGYPVSAITAAVSYDRIEQLTARGSCLRRPCKCNNPGAQANFAVFLTLLEPGDTIGGGMDLNPWGQFDPRFASECVGEVNSRFVTMVSAPDRTTPTMTDLGSWRCNRLLICG